MNSLIPQKIVDEASFKVIISYTKDNRKGIARINPNSMKALGISKNDIVEIKGRKKTIAKCLPLSSTENVKGIIRINQMLRTNAKVDFGDKVTLRKIIPKKATKIKITSIKSPNSINDIDFFEIILKDIPLHKGMNVNLPFPVGNLEFKIKQIEPKADAVLTNKDTIFEIN